MESFRLGQREIIQSVSDKKDVLAVMPTGGGKSLCYQLPAILGEGITIVISPLIALMNDQVEALKRLGLPGGCIHSGMGVNEKKEIFARLKESENFILYLSPERVQKPGFANWVRQQKIHLIAVDEAHCVSQWGHDFRPEYSQLSRLRDLCPDVPMIGLTATATPAVKKDIIFHLGLRTPDQHVYGFYRPNLYYQVEFCTQDAEKEAYVLQALEQTKTGRIIIYCGTRKKTEDWATLLEEQGESVAFYHAGLSAQERTKIEKQYQSGEIRILAATNAFGMGVDHPDVRLVIHTQIPANIESYYQEVGRAGRDGKDSTCLLIYSKKDKGLHSYFIRESNLDSWMKSHRWQALDAMIQYAEGSECRHADILTYFNDRKRIERCGHCDACLVDSPRRIQKPAALQRVLTRSKKRSKEALFVPDMSDESKWRMDHIREWRKQYAKENDIPAFMVFSDKTLRDLVLRAPTNTEDLSKVYGLGKKKIEVFGQLLLEKLHP